MEIKSGFESVDPSLLQALQEDHTAFKRFLSNITDYERDLDELTVGMLGALIVADPQRVLTMCQKQDIDLLNGVIMPRLDHPHMSSLVSFLVTYPAYCDSYDDDTIEVVVPEVCRITEELSRWLTAENASDLLLEEFNPNNNAYPDLRVKKRRQAEALRIIESVLTRREQWSGFSLTEPTYSISIYFAENFMAEATLEQLMGYLFDGSLSYNDLEERKFCLTAFNMLVNLRFKAEIPNDVSEPVEDEDPFFLKLANHCPTLVGALKGDEQVKLPMFGSSRKIILDLVCLLCRVPRARSIIQQTPLLSTLMDLVLLYPKNNIMQIRIFSILLYILESSPEAPYETLSNPENKIFSTILTCLNENAQLMKSGLNERKEYLGFVTKIVACILHYRATKPEVSDFLKNNAEWSSIASETEKWNVDEILTALQIPAAKIPPLSVLHGTLEKFRMDNTPTTRLNTEVIKQNWQEHVAALRANMYKISLLDLGEADSDENDTNEDEEVMVPPEKDETKLGDVYEHSSADDNLRMEHFTTPLTEMSSISNEKMWNFSPYVDTADTATTTA